MSVMGLDYGRSTVGVAISDSMLITAQPIETITRKGENKLRRTFARIIQLIDEYGVDRIVVGDPKNMDGSESERSRKSAEFAKQLETKTGFEVILVDERLTTRSASAVLTEAGVRSDSQKKYVDKLAASIILQTYLDSLMIKSEI